MFFFLLLFYYFIFKGTDCIQKFCKELEIKAQRLYNQYWKTFKTPNNNLEIDEECMQEYNNCAACDESINTDEREMFFNYFTGQYEGPIHTKCKSTYKFRFPTIPVVFHNLSKYDIHLFITELGGALSIIPCNKELYISITKKVSLERKYLYNIQFIDSNRFLNSSLEKLSSYLNDEDFKLMKKKFDGVKFNQMRRKGVFPYDYLDSFSKLTERQLPSRDLFYNSLNYEECSIEDYEFAQQVWQNFNCKTLSDYLKLYLESDVIILADVFENFRTICHSIYKLDPINYVTAPSISWDAMLKYTKVKLELISNSDIYNFLKLAIRGGLTQCSHRISEANNPYLKNFDPSIELNYLAYIDANNLYGWAMSQTLPISNFKFISQNEISKINFPKTSVDGEIGYILEVDLDYPESIHNKHNCLPFCPENKIPPGGKQIKLVADLTPKTNYIIHLKQLQLCLDQGLKLKKIHRVLSFSQENWLRPYIHLNNRHRTEAKNEFEKNFFKLMNNAVYGKTMENVEKRRTIRLVTDYHSKQNSPGFRQLVAMNNFHSMNLFGNGLAAIEHTTTSVHYDKPIYIGVTVLELSKWLMYDYYYKFMLAKSPSTKIIYMDTDSFITSSKDDVYKLIKNNPERFDTSNYTIENSFKIIPKNKKELGLFKDENAGKIMMAFAGLKAKAYSYKVENNDSFPDSEVKKVKGVKGSVVKKLSHSDYIECIKKRKTYYGEQRVIRSRGHELYTELVNKISLNYKDDKRFVLTDKVSTMAWGHYNIPK
ncbi:PolB [Drosophila-associated adintovirus 2]|uniref:DNA-directed DNA polymerase n=1 Tax=Drosophila-associated adintovirus 2 TaxID=2744817 RepID=A0A7D4ZIQ4_9VIRU|nr:PolB [Drosophila-associated adintovirus 2]